MDNELVLYTAPSGISMTPSALDLPVMMTYNRALKQRETEKIIQAVNVGLYDMAAEYVWSRTINILKKDIMQFGDEFVAEMLDRPNGDIDSISEYEIISLSADLGFINKTAKMEFLQFSETIQHYRSDDEPDEEYPSTKLVDMVRSCIKHVLGYDTFEYEVPFVTFRDRLKAEIINTSHPMYSQLMSSPYFYKKTITKTLLNLAKTLHDSAERENIFANIGYIIPGVWQELSSDDRWAVGRSYAQANSDGDLNLSRSLKSILIKIKGFDYVPENLRSNSFIKAAKDLLSAHFGMNNFYNEVSYAKILSEMGSSIPAPAFGTCMTSVLACKLGNNYGNSWDAEQYLDSILKRVSPDRWIYYFDTVFPTDETILYKLTTSQGLLKRFSEIVVMYKLHEMTYKNPEINKCMQAFNNDNLRSAKKCCDDLYRKLNRQ